MTNFVRDFVHDKAIAHATVTFRPAEARGQTYHTQSDKKGPFQIRGLATGCYDVRIAGRDFDPLERVRVMAPRATRILINATVLKRGVVIACQ